MKKQLNGSIKLMMKHYKSILEKILLFHHEENTLFIHSNYNGVDSFDLLSTFEKDLVKLMLKDRCIKHYGKSQYIYNIISTFFIIKDDKLIYIFDGFFKFDDNIVDYQTYSYIIDECDELIYYYEYTDNV